MVITMSNNATEDQIRHVIDRIRECGFREHVSRGTEKTVIGVVGSNGSRNEIEALRAAPGVESVTPITQSYKLVSKQMKPERTTVRVGDVCFGGPEVVVIAGPCSVESRDQLLSTARAVQAAGATMLRGGAYKPRTSPYDFQGLGVDALRFLKEAREETGLPVVTEVMRTFHCYGGLLVQQGPSCSNAGRQHRSGNGCWQPSTCSLAAIRMSCCANEESRLSKLKRATRSTCQPSPWPGNSLTCR